MNNYYVYFHRNPLTNVIFYVGVGKDNRYKSIVSRNQFWKYYVAKHNFIPEIRINYLTKEQALYFEKKYIAFFGRRRYNINGTLVNLTEGGFGRLGDPQTDEIKNKISQSLLKSMEIDPTIKSRSANSRIGLKRNDDTKLKMSLNNGSKSIEEKERRKLALNNPNHGMRLANKENPPMKGKKHSNETKRKISEAKKGKIPWNKGLIIKNT